MINRHFIHISKTAKTHKLGNHIRHLRPPKTTKLDLIEFCDLNTVSNLILTLFNYDTNF